MESIIDVEITGHVALITMVDREKKNQLSERLIVALTDTLSQLGSNSDVSVIVLCGYDNYFCCGGDVNEIANRVSQRQAVFNKECVFELVLNCKLPIISAMQGHALGAGLALGLYCDFIFMAEQSIYSANFMKYDFTPGFGSTYILPKKMGYTLGHEMLYGAKNYYGLELKQRGAGVNVVDKENVLDDAMKFAGNLAKSSRHALITLKSGLNRDLEAELSQAIDNELHMHEQTLYKQSVASKISLPL
ncbi:Putative polyketide biosynthesis enoyl-CoA isomerase PksI [Pseudoalteromonas sp. CIP111854]|uniref:Polyketide biosynthesis enoyl-CoA isomerase PksI n=1 Tax=Pseudoalteromonas holothuriae TaxID=2963714 RepID=A0A9W4R4T0_9GAMM|nr:polyketide synthase [Pseudoalteromonas sp. CIP111854]CAH9067139.1 Putative polyketide biosynthesis enoyl-CoA isomerase PksI [Pseudoalteromonas sp. CIP111854]